MTFAILATGLVKSFRRSRVLDGLDLSVAILPSGREQAALFADPP